MILVRLTMQLAYTGVSFPYIDPTGGRTGNEGRL